MDDPKGVTIRANEILGRGGESIEAAEIVRAGRAFAAWIAAAPPSGEARRVAIAADARPSSADLRDALVRGLASGGLTVADLGHAPPAVLLTSMRRLRLDGGLAVTGGHLPLDRNGVRLYLRERPLAADEVRAVLRRARDLPEERLLPVRGSVTRINMIPDYIRGLERAFAPLRRRLKHQSIHVVVAACRGIASLTAPHALSRIGCRVFRLGCTLDPGANGSAPDPSDPALLRELGLTVRASRADLGVLLGGDGERVRVVDHRGRAVTPDLLLALLAADTAAAIPGAAVACDVRMSDLVDEAVEAWGGRVVLGRPGESTFLESPRLREASLGGEAEGVLTFRDRSAAPADGTYAALRLIDLLARKREEADRPLPLRAILPSERFRSPDLDLEHTLTYWNFNQLADRLRARALPLGQVRTLHVDPDYAVRLRTDDGWGVLFRSPDSGAPRAAYEGRTDEGFHRMGALFRGALGPPAEEQAASRAADGAGGRNQAGSSPRR
ncbi:MAG: hypothetical protein ABIH26_14875 [Candidatus Eisenbacteria bacterium]